MSTEDLPTPEQVAAYLEARGWVSIGGFGVCVYWTHGDYDTCAGYPSNPVRHPRLAQQQLAYLAGVEGRPTTQVRRDMVSVGFRIEPAPTCTCGFNPLRGRPVSKALVVCLAGRTHIIVHIGADLDCELEAVGAADTLRGLSNGVWVVECRICAWTSYYGEHDYELQVLGQRPPTDEEWTAWVEYGEEPWDDKLSDHYAWTYCAVHPRAIQKKAVRDE